MSVDKELGVCRCKVEDLEQICDSDCRIKNKRSIQLICSDSADQNYLQITEGDNVQKITGELIENYVLNHKALLTSQGCDKKTKTVSRTDCSFWLILVFSHLRCI